MAAMDIGKRMMEKWGWSKGQGLGKDNKGMTSCLILRKNDGSANQGRIEQAAPLVVPAKTAKAAAAGTAAATAPEVAGTAPVTINAAPAAPVRGLSSKIPAPRPPEWALSAAAAALVVGASDVKPELKQEVKQEAKQEPIEVKEEPVDVVEPPRKKRKSKWDDDPDDEIGVQDVKIETAKVEPKVEEMTSEQIMQQLAREKAEAEARLAAAYPGAMLGGAQGAMPGAMPEGMLAGAAQAMPAAHVLGGAMPPTMPAAMPVTQLGAMGGVAESAVSSSQAGAGLTGSSPATSSAAAAPADPEPTYAIPLLEPPKRKQYQRQWWVRDDWRWSKGFEALRFFEELQLPPRLFELAKKVLVELTAWNTIILRPRGTGADVVLAKKMLYAVMHPSQEGLRNDVLFQDDEEAEAAIADPTQFMDGVDENIKAAPTFEFSVEKNVNSAKMRRVGLGAEIMAQEEVAEPIKMDRKEILLPTAEDIVLAKAHISDLRIATGVSVVMKGSSILVHGKEKAVQRAEQLMQTLMITGEWVALTESFVISEDTNKVKKKSSKEDDGPSEQILIKVPEGQATQLIEKHLKAMERAAEADKLKLSTRPIAGKRTLMVDGVRKAHERVKLMAKELAEKGESPMLTKAMAAAKWGPKDDTIKVVEVGTKASSTATPVQVPTASSNSSTPGVVSAPPVLHAAVSSSASPDASNSSPADTTSGPKPARPAMRHLPPPKLAAAMASGSDLFAGLPKADTSANAGSDMFAGLPQPTIDLTEDPEPSKALDADAALDAALDEAQSRQTKDKENIFDPDAEQVPSKQAIDPDAEPASAPQAKPEFPPAPPDLAAISLAAASQFPPVPPAATSAPVQGITE